MTTVQFDGEIQKVIRSEGKIYIVMTMYSFGVGVWNAIERQLTFAVYLDGLRSWRILDNAEAGPAGILVLCPRCHLPKAAKTIQ